MKNFEVAGEEVLVANVRGHYYVIGNRCTHVGAPLVEGRLEGHIVECPWHGSRFDLRTGTVTAEPAREPTLRYEVKVEGTSILVSV